MSKEMENKSDANSFNEQFIEINSVPTHVIQYGLKQFITNNNCVADDSTIVLMISGSDF